MSNTIGSGLPSSFNQLQGNTDTADLKSDIKSQMLARSAANVDNNQNAHINTYRSALSEAYDGDTDEAMAAAAQRGAKKSEGSGGDIDTSSILSEITLSKSKQADVGSNDSGQDNGSDDASSMQGAAAVSSVSATSANFRSTNTVNLAKDHAQLMQISSAMEKFELSSMLNAPSFDRLADILSGDRWKRADTSASSINAKISASTSS